MPLRAIICPVNHVITPLSTCLDCALHYRVRTDPQTGAALGHCAHHYAQLHAITRQDEHRTDAGVSATMVTGCLRRLHLEAVEAFAVYPDDLRAALDGTAWHQFLEPYNRADAACEVRLAYNLPSGRVLTGQVDCYIPDPGHLLACLPAGPGYPGGRIEDHKTKDEGKSQLEASPIYYTLQQNIYRLMITRGCATITSDHPAIPAGTYIQGPVDTLTLYPGEHTKSGPVVHVPLLDLDELEAFLEECYDFIDGAAAGHMPPRDAEPRTSYFCQHYCPVSASCAQYTAGLAAAGQDDPIYHPADRLTGAIARPRQAALPLPAADAS